MRSTGTATTAPRHRARQFTHADFARNDLVVALDRSHERILRGWARTEADADKIALLMSFEHGARTLDVPDPYYAGPGMFDEVLGHDRGRQPVAVPPARAGDPPPGLPWSGSPAAN